MAASDKMETVPGLFMLPLPMNKLVNIDKDVVLTKSKELKHDAKARQGLPEELAIENFLGVLAFRIRDYEDALEHFNHVLSIDRRNANALSNMQYVMEKLYRMTEAQSYKNTLENLLHLEDRTEKERQQCLLVKARCLAEQAYAYACDIHIDRVGEIRYFKANQLFQDSLSLAGSLMDSWERDNWKFCMAKNDHKIIDFLVYKGDYNRAEIHLKRAEKHFYEVTQTTPGNKELQWESWRHLADLIRGTIHRKEFNSHEWLPELQEYRKNPEKCMMKAVEISPQNAKLLARYANFIHSVGKKKRKDVVRDSTERALEKLDKSIELDKSENNFYAFSTRARINLYIYKFLLAEAEKKNSGKPDPKYLEKAEVDFKTSLSMSVSPWDLSYLGEVYHLLAKDPYIKVKGDKEVRKCLENALLYFTRAADCQDGESRREVHLMRGRCLNDMGEYLTAISCFKLVIQCEPEVYQFSGNFNELLQVYLHLLKTTGKQFWDDPLVPEIVYNLKKAQLKYGRSILQKHTISKMNTKFAEEIQKLAKYCRNFSHHQDLIPLLTSERKEPPFSPPVRTGGSLEQPWKAKSLIPNLPASSGAAPLVSHLSSVDTREGELPSSGVKNEVRIPQDVNSLAAKVEDLQITEPQEPREKIRQAPESARVSGFEFDFYVVYAKSIKSWVFNTLLPELEGIGGLKGCIRDRNAKPGTYKIEEENEQMKVSASILVVIGEEFTQSEKYSMHQALRLRREETTGCKRMIIPVLQDKDAQMPDELDVFTSFDATRGVKWDKLANCIEQQVKLVSL